MNKQTPDRFVSGTAFEAAPLDLDPDRHALFLDFDGTLAPIQDHPDQVFLSEGQLDRLCRLSRHMDGALAIISGRDVRDLDRRTPGALWRAGGHGSDICAPGQRPRAFAPSAPDALQHGLHRTAREFPGVRIETKGPVLAVHYRAAPDVARALHDRLSGIVAQQPGYSLQAGKMVFEAKPETASKARAIARLMQMPPFRGRRPVMVGDDTTDEDGMREAVDRGGSGIKIGPGDTLAGYRLADPDALWRWLEESLS